MSKVAIGAGLGLVAVGIGMKAGVLGKGGETDPEDVAFIPITGGVLIALVSTFVLLGTPEDKPEPATPSPPDADGPARDPRSANDLAIQATATARAGNCRAALRLTEEVRALDAERHAALVRDAGIARCLATPSAVP